MTPNLKARISLFSPKTYWREILAFFMLLLAIVFFNSERKELSAIIPHIKQANPLWLIVAFVITIATVMAQAGIYRNCFSAIRLFLKWDYAADLFLKRNFISVFLPAGGVSALAYSPSQIRKAGFSKMQVHQASGLFGFAGLLTVFLAGLPVVIFVLFTTSRFKDSLIGLLAVLAIISLLFFTVRALKNKRALYRWIDKKFPMVTPSLNELFAANVNVNKFYVGVGFSLGVELTGMLHVFVAMLALGLPASFSGAAAAYIISIIMMVISPFLRGLGAVEILMVYVLEQFGYSSVDALAITIVYRVFEFWLPFIGGLFAFAWKGRKLFLRLAPAVLTFALGLVNIISAITPPIRERISHLRYYIPGEAINASNLLVLFIGLFLLLTAAFLFRGLRNAWVIAICLSLFSLIGNLTKALDYEEAILAAITFIVLVATSSQYRILSSNKWMQAGVKTAILSFVAVSIFGFTSFYFIDVKHFGENFTWQQAIRHTINMFLMVRDNSLHPVTRFGHEFIWLIRIVGLLTWSFLLLTLIKPHFKKPLASESQREKAKFLLSQFGNSANDYFKIYKDKLYFFSDIHEAFIAYRVARGFAIVLEEPVCAPDNKIDVLQEFEHHCRKMGLRPAFYRVDENSMPWFNELKKQKLIIGQEAILEVNRFTLEGKDKKSMRNGQNSLKKNGYTVQLVSPPHRPEFMAALKNVSEEWLEEFDKEEFVFSQGMFDEKELMQQEIIALFDTANNVKAFLNIIPDYAEEECTYDLIRKTKDAPGAAMDALILRLIEHAKAQHKIFLNLGLVPMMGIEQPGNTAEQIMKLAAANLKRFKHYKGLKEFKEKYSTLWENKYLVYDDDFDLLQLPLAINSVMKP